MLTVDVADLKADLSAHLHTVKNGAEIVVCDSDGPLARIVPLETEDEYAAQERRLIARGVLTAPLEPMSETETWPEPPGNVPAEVMAQLWREEREGR
jgi:antitoxin (DNA-binding transcriptional repressor) of toxin-antitoxin stability system